MFVNFWDHHRARFQKKKSKNLAYGVTVRTKKIKIICADIVSVELSYDIYFKCERKYAVLNKNIKIL